jgi:competence protein ComEC
VFTREEAAFSRGDSVVVSGKLKPTKGTTKQGIVIFSEITAHSNAQSYLESLRTRFFDSVRRALPEPHSSLGLGYLVGLRADIPKELSEQLSTTGLTHIIAVSGYNLTIIVQLVRRLLGKRSAYQSVVCAGLLLAGFLLVSGGSAPIIRASVVCGFSLVAWYYGRVFNPLVLLLLSGGITAFANPLYIWGDPGWYLSFLAFAGVLILAPLVVAHIYKNKTPNTIIHIFVETLCAQIATVPYSLYLFGGVSLIAPLANVLVLPFIPFIMFAVFITGITGMVLPVIAAYIGLIPSSLIALQTWIVQVLSTVSWAHRTVLITKTVMVALFITIVLLMLTLRRATRSDKVASWHDGLL